MENIIVIPIFKETLSEFEIISVQQCFKIFSSKKIFFAHPNNLALNFYKERFQEAHYEEFSADFFRSIKDYNRLMLSKMFYNRFLKYDYLLIYQTDCYVFRDELDYWSKMSYDYIGGIWFENFSGSIEKGDQIWFAGNGGFSLRNIKKIHNLLKSKKPFDSPKRLLKEFASKKSISSLALFFLKICGFRNTVNYFAQNYQANEDGFFHYLSQRKILKVPSVEDSLLFSWDRRPDYLYSYLEKLPFGVHAWFRTDEIYKENLAFWKKFININSSEK